MGQIQAALSESVGVCACEGISGNSAVRTTARCQLRARFKGVPNAAQKPGACAPLILWTHRPDFEFIFV